MAAHSDSTSALVAVSIWICSVCSGMAKEICGYRKGNREMAPFTICHWGCCWKYFADPCCATPVGLIIGCTFAGLLFLSLMALAVYCCCSRKRARSRPSVVVSYADSRVAFNSNTAMPADTTTTLPLGIYAPPPSYDEVMSGQYNINPAFNPLKTERGF